LVNREKLKNSVKSIYNYINSDLIESNDKKNLRFKGSGATKTKKEANSMVRNQLAKEAKKLMKEKNLVTTK
jgi:hypothetical protein